VICAEPASSYACGRRSVVPGAVVGLEERDAGELGDPDVRVGLVSLSAAAA
jgi:hypothetical protein